MDGLIALFRAVTAAAGLLIQDIYQPFMSKGLVAAQFSQDLVSLLCAPLLVAAMIFTRRGFGARVCRLEWAIGWRLKSWVCICSSPWQGWSPSCCICGTWMAREEHRTMDQTVDSYRFISGITKLLSRNVPG